ncbi:MAG: type IV pilus secretin PilQ [Desulfobacterales bacterium]|nr:type IV pilus secretin PilQ [Desulfobacterales bacterium]
MLNRRYFLNIGKVLLLGVLATAMLACAAKSVKEEKPEAASPEPLAISDVQAKSIHGGMGISVNASDELDYTAIKRRDPLSVILYFPNTHLKDVPPVELPDNDIVSSVKPSMAENQKNARIEIALLKDLPYKVEKDGTSLQVVFRAEASSAAPSGQEAPAGSSEEAMAAESAASFEEDDRDSAGYQSSGASKKTEAPEPDRADSTEPALVQRIDFSAEESGKSVISVETSKPVAYQIEKIRPRLLKLKLNNSRLPEYHQGRPLITTRFDSAVDRVIPAKSAEADNVTEILIELREQVPYRPVKSNGLLAIHFEASSIGPRPFEAANLPSWQNVLENSLSPETPTTVSGKKPSAMPAEPENPYADLLGEDKEYTGEKIALDFFETNIKNVFRILQQVSGKNFAIDPNVQGSVTLSFQKPVPWDQVLDLVLQMNGLDKVEKGEIIRIATKGTLRAEEEARRQKIEAIQKRKEQQKQLEPLVTEYIEISYANAQNEVLPHVKDALSKERGSVTVDSRNNQLIITDTQAKIRKAKEIITEIDKVTPQVIIEARIVEANDNFSRKVGVTWGAQSEDVYRSDLGGNYSYNSVVNTPFIGGGAEGGTESPSLFNFSFERLPSMGTPFLLDATLRAMETEQVLKIISTPKIVTLDNKEATITQGVEWPYQNVEEDEVQTEFKEINLTLKVTPHITPDERVSLEIDLQKDDIQEITASGEPAISTNNAQTELLIDNGQTIVIGGIVKRTESNAQAGLPILKDIPGIGWLFSAKQDEVVKRELLIFMTPNIVQLEQRGLAQAQTE